MVHHEKAYPVNMYLFVIFTQTQPNLYRLLIYILYNTNKRLLEKQKKEALQINNFIHNVIIILKGEV